MNKLSRYRPCGSLDATATGKLLYLVLEGLADENGEATVAQSKLCGTLRISRSAVRRNLRRLERTGAIGVVPTYHGDGGRAANKYLIK